MYSVVNTKALLQSPKRETLLIETDTLRSHTTIPKQYSGMKLISLTDGNLKVLQTLLHQPQLAIYIASKTFL
ncbi:hypothetical protein Gotur_020879 [Gossypium turneri]